MAETPATKEGAQDPSMEEILQSIRSIIAEDGDGKGEAKKPNGDVAGSDVLELTEMVQESPAAAPPTAPAVEAPKAQAAPAPAAPAAPAATPGDVLGAIDAALTPSATGGVAAAAASTELLSEPAAAAAAASMKKLQEAAAPPLQPIVAAPSPGFRSGKTVEDMVAEMLLPMIKAWLDANLPTIVERIVEREVRRLSK